MQHTDLTGVSVLFTRPQGQGDGLCAAIQARGGEVVRLPLVQIEPFHQTPDGLTDVQFDRVIFVSPNAVRFGLERLANRLRTGHPELLAIGPATAELLSQSGYKDVVIPGQDSNSEELLKSPALRNLQNQNILIVRGRGGRELLAEGLCARGASVQYLEVYERHYPRDDPHDILVRWLGCETRVILLTSVGALTALGRRCRAADFQRVLSAPALVLSRRIADACRESGWQAEVKICPPGDDASMLRCMRSLVTGSE